MYALRQTPFSQGVKGIGVHHFFKAQGGGSAREITILDRGLNDRVHFISSEEGYIFYEGANSADGLHIVKAGFDYGTAGESKTLGQSTAVWRKQGPVGVMVNTVAEASPDGVWLLFSTRTASTAGRPVKTSDRMLYVLEAATGETVFALPTDNIDAQIQRLSSVLPPQPTNDDLGWATGAYFAGNHKLVVERLKDASDRETARFYDVYDMNSISLDAQPEYRVESNQHRENPCPSKGFPGTLLAAENGRLAYTGLQ